MEPDGQYDKEENRNPMFVPRNFFLSIWLRRIVQDRDGVDRFFLDYGRYFLPTFGFICWLLFLIIQG
jgi:hypothetical protein